MAKQVGRSSAVYDFMSSVITAVIFVALILVFFFRVAIVNETSMTPTLSDGDRLVITSLSASYDHGDIVIIHRDNDVSLVKRVIATAGDTIDIDFEEGIVFLNGEALDEPYIAEPTHLSFADGPEFPLTIPEGYLFCMGDNRNNSLDSRTGSIGLINEQYIIGKMVLDLNERSAK